MKKWLGVILLSLYLCSTTELYQVMKVPVLIEHYFEHKAANPEMTVYAFLKLHYDHPVKDADWQADQKLPFITHSEHLTVIFTINPIFSLNLKESAVPIFSPKIAAHDDTVLDWDISDAVWQPPKFC